MSGGAIYSGNGLEDVPSIGFFIWIQGNNVIRSAYDKLFIFIFLLVRMLIIDLILWFFKYIWDEMLTFWSYLIEIRKALAGIFFCSLKLLLLIIYWERNAHAHVLSFYFHGRGNEVLHFRQQSDLDLRFWWCCSSQVLDKNKILAG